MSALPLSYLLEICEGSFINDPVWSVEAKTPFPTIAIGDRFNSRSLEGRVAWPARPAQGQHFRVKDVEHMFWQIESAEIGHKLMVSLEIVADKD
ncbi:hypothetical protein ABIC89_000264 [Variovorax boronicumulans]|uniref:hypothetical protein n=1 Tax=Variovorax boronicumulans TaxID=436515 RepID=UPI003397194A